MSHAPVTAQNVNNRFIDCSKRGGWEGLGIKVGNTDLLAWDLQSAPVNGQCTQCISIDAAKNKHFSFACNVYKYSIFHPLHGALSVYMCVPEKWKVVCYVHFNKILAFLIAWDLTSNLKLDILSQIWPQQKWVISSRFWNFVFVVLEIR